MQINEYNITLYKSLREEINLRINTHYKTLIFKFAGMGAIFSVLIAQSIVAVPFVAAAVYGFLLDILMLENLGWIRGCGGFIKKQVEAKPDVFQPHNEPPEPIKWEHYIQANRWNCFSAQGYFLGVWMVGPLLIPGFIVFALIESTETSHLIMGGYALLISILAAVYTLRLIWKKLASKEHDSFWKFVRMDILSLEVARGDEE